MRNFIHLKRDEKPVISTPILPLNTPKISYVPLKYPYFILKCEKGPMSHQLKNFQCVLLEDGENLPPWYGGWVDLTSSRTVILPRLPHRGKLYIYLFYLSCTEVNLCDMR
jgi:hypothetical protein